MINNSKVLADLLKVRSQIKDRLVPILLDLKHDRNQENRAVMISDLEDEINIMHDLLLQVYSNAELTDQFLSELLHLAYNQGAEGYFLTCFTEAEQIVNNYNERKTDA